MARPKKWTPDKIAALGADMVKWFKDNPDEFFFESYYQTREDVTRDVVSYLKSIDETFSRTLKTLAEIQENRLANAMIKQKINVVAGIFVLKNKHGWVDKQEIKTENRNVNVEMPKGIDELTEEQARERINQLTQGD